LINTPNGRGRRKEHFHSSSLIKTSTDDTRGGGLFEMQRNCFDINWKFSTVKIFPATHEEFVVKPGGKICCKYVSRP